MKLLTRMLRFLARGLRAAGLLSTPLPRTPEPPPTGRRMDIPLEALVSAGSPALRLSTEEQTPAGRLSPAEQRIWEDMVAGLTGLPPNGE
jgi:hypothetical protein